MTADALRAELGSRHDPHRQARAARTAPPLLHSLTTHREVLERVFHHLRPRSVVEVGVESGSVSAAYLELGAEVVYGVDPRPDESVRETFAAHDGLHLVTRTSPDALSDIPLADLYVLDGDHNYAVVHAELQWVVDHAPDAVVVLHDVLWPCARRDLYYEPTVLPVEDRHPRSAEGPTIWHDHLSDAGFVGLGAFTTAVEAGGERNGVLTAIEDVLAEAAAHWDLHIVPAVFGLGVVVRRDTDLAGRLASDLRSWTESRLLLAMENNRIALYTRVLELQHRATETEAALDSMAETIAAQHGEIDRLREQLTGVGCAGSVAFVARWPHSGTGGRA